MEFSGRTYVSLLSFFVEGDPIPKQSFTMGDGGRGYTKESVVSWSEYVTTGANIAMRDQLARYNNPITHGFLAADLTFVLGHIKPVDCDNLAKCVLDAMAGIVYANDKQVIDLSSRKYWINAPYYPGIEPPRKIESPSFIHPGPPGVYVAIKRVDLG